jgi:protocatechuate 3,4-dioxygenase alpha subunit
MAEGPTPSQTIGPFFRFGMDWMNAENLADPADPAAVVITGRVLDGADQPVPDALLEVWQADARGRFGAEAAPGWTGFGRSLTDEQGAYRFTTIKPGAVPAADGRLQAPHIDVTVFARGLLQRLVTRIYFPDEAAANAADPVLAGIADPAVRATLIASGGGRELRFDVHLQGPLETAFFAY